MYISFKVKNFRGFESFEIDRLSRVNLIAGLNNVGKTALLEALFLYSGAYNPALTITLNNIRGIDTIAVESASDKTPWDSIFFNFKIDKQIELIGIDNANRHRILKLKVARPQMEEIFDGKRLIQGEISSAVNPKLIGVNSFVLELEYEETGKKKGKSSLVVDANGIRSQVIRPPPFQAVFLPSRSRSSVVESAERFGKLEIIGKHEILQEALKVFEPRLRRLSVLVIGGVPMIHGDIGLNRLLPLPQMGDGMTRLADIILAIGNAPNGIVLVDEIENGIHHSAMPNIWRAIDRASQLFSTQVFATTHSLECIKAAHSSFKENDAYDFRVHRLERTDARVRAMTYGKDELEAAFEIKLEVR
jgi:AAA15 family ATPase/GTPase